MTPSPWRSKRTKRAAGDPKVSQTLRRFWSSGSRFRERKSPERYHVSLRGQTYTWYMFICTECTFFCTSASGRGSFSRALGRVARRGSRVYTASQVWALAGLRGACSRCSKSRRAGSFRGIVFLPTRANQVHGNPKMSFYFVF